LAEGSTDRKALLAGVIEHCHEGLKNSPDAQKYLQGRGLVSSEMIELKACKFLRNKQK
jgi:hypothetical protein